VSGEPTIKAIPTKYKGYKFRSRLEARWAVFLDGLDLNWEYEKEGYQLDTTWYDQDGHEHERTTWYLPDFWVADWDAFLEVKPSGPMDHEAFIKADALSFQSEKPLIVVCGQPWPGEYEAWLFDPEWIPTPRTTPKPIAPGRFAQCMATHTVWMLIEDGEERWGMVLSKERHGKFCTDGRSRYVFYPGDTENLKAAYEAARSARFERH
jgi:hypothetical protein